MQSVLRLLKKTTKLSGDIDHNYPHPFVKPEETVNIIVRFFTNVLLRSEAHQDELA